MKKTIGWEWGIPENFKVLKWWGLLWLTTQLHLPFKDTDQPRITG